VIASTVIIFISVFISNMLYTEINSNYIILITISLILKAGVAPFHFWFPQIIRYTEWFQSILLLTWQKIAPLILISFSMNYIVWLAIASSSIVGIIGGLNQIELKKILTFSSIIHSAWLISVIFISDKLWWAYYSIYCLLLISVITPCSVLKISTLNRINYTQINIKCKILVILNLLSIAGLPPFLGFSIKIIAIRSLISLNFNKILIIILIVSSLIAFYFYARLMYSTILVFSQNPKILLVNPSMGKIVSKILIFRFFGNMLVSVLVLLA
jgi:NADH-ubiquinone oxidoreductase chain 2